MAPARSRRPSAASARPRTRRRRAPPRRPASAPAQSTTRSQSSGPALVWTRKPPFRRSSAVHLRARQHPRAERGGGARERGCGEQRVGAALERAEQAAGHSVGDVGRDAREAGAVEQLDLDAERRARSRPCARGRAAAPRRRRRSARPETFTSRSTPSSCSSSRQKRIAARISGSDGPNSRAHRSPVQQERLELDLAVEAARVAARRLRVQVVPLDERHLGARLREVVGGRGARDAAADHDDDVLVVPPATARIMIAVRQATIRSQPEHASALPRQLHRHDHALHRGRVGDRRRRVEGLPRLAARGRRARDHRARDDRRVPDGVGRGAAAARGHGDRARRRPDPGAGRRDERLDRRAPCATRARPRSSAPTG